MKSITLHILLIEAGELTSPSIGNRTISGQKLITIDELREFAGKDEFIIRVPATNNIAEYVIPVGYTPETYTGPDTINVVFMPEGSQLVSIGVANGHVYRMDQNGEMHFTLPFNGEMLVEAAA